MKKILIATWLNNNNFGTILQAYSLQKFLTNQKYKVENLEYVPTTKERILNLLINQNSPKVFMNRYKDKLKSTKEYKIAKHAQTQKFNKFKQNNIKTTKIYKTRKELNELNNKYDVFICGSDQIWSPKVFNPVYFLSFIKSKSVKIAYAPSFGVVSINKSKGKKVKEYLSSFSHISVREESGQTILFQLLDKNYKVNVDPTLLIEKEEWIKMANQIKSKYDNYIFCFFLTYNKNYFKKIKNMAKELNKKIIIVNFGQKINDPNIIVENDLGPKEWLNLIKNADFVCTDSYHGFIFSVIFNKQLIIYKRFSDDNSWSQNSRIYNLAKKIDMQDRICDEKTDIDITESIDYKNVEHKLNKEIEKSKEWLIDCIN